MSQTQPETKTNMLVKKIYDEEGNQLGGISGQLVKIGSSSVSDLVTAIQTTLQSDDSTLDTVQELVAYIKTNRTDINSILTDKVDKTAIYDGLDSTEAGKVLSAAQGKALKALLDALSASLATVAADAAKVDLAVINEGDEIPANVRVGGIVLELGTA